MNVIVSLLLFLISFSTNDYDLDIAQMSLYEKSEKLEITEPIDKYQLKSFPIIVNSEKIFVDDIFLSRSQDYEIDYNSGYIYFKRTIPLNSNLKINYKIIPIDIKREYKRRLFTPKEEKQKSEIQRGEMTKKREPTPESSLQVSGTKTFSVSLGSKRSLSPDQSLNVNISGNVSKDVSILAILSDQELPFQPEGTTEELSDFDQKLIKISSPNFSATMGDFRASLSDSELVFFSRALEGVSANAKFRSLNLDVIPSAIPKGESASKTIYGVEGQSEYRIDVNGRFVVVKAGSEIVWLNGEKMTRGEDNDYIIRDYGDPTIEFTNKHLITSNDVIRVDFEYIQEDAAYGRELHGASAGLNLLDERAKVVLSWAVEADDKNKPYILLDKETIDKLKRNQLDDEDSIIPPRKHSVWGLNGSLKLGELFLQGEFATDQVDKNSFSNIDEIEKNNAWRINANSLTENLQANLDLRYYDANFSPVGATTQNRTRMLYEERYQNEDYGDVFFQEQLIAENFDEGSLQFDLQYQPLDGITVNAGVGNNSRNPKEQESNTSSLDDKTGTKIGVEESNNWNRGIRIDIPDFPDISNRYQESSSKIDNVDNFRRIREIWRMSHNLGNLNIEMSKEQIQSIDLDLSDEINRNYKHDEIDFEGRLMELKWMDISGKFGIEESYKKKEKFLIDGTILSYGDWELDTNARTWMFNISSKPRNWIDSAMNLSRRVFKTYGDTALDTTTNLADFNLRLTPLKRSIDLGINYEVDKKLSKEKVEIFTNEILGREIEPGQGNYVKIDEYHYQEDYEKGDYIRIVRTVGDKPISSIDAEFRLRFSPKRIFRPTSLSYSRLIGKRDSEEPKLPQDTGNKTFQFLKNFEIDARFDITEEQENPNFTELYLLRNLLEQKTVFGRQIQRYRVEFAPSIFFSTELSHYRNRLLNKRINSVERRQNSQEWRLGINFTPISKLSFDGQYKTRSSQEKLINLGIEANQALDISNINTEENMVGIGSRYELTELLSIKLQGEIETEKGIDLFEPESETSTRQSSIETGLTFSLIGKGRIDLSYRAAYGKINGELPIARYGFYDGISHELRMRADYKMRKFTDLIIRLNYRFFTSELTKPEHRAEIEAVADL